MPLPSYPLPIIPARVLINMMEAGQLSISNFDPARLSPTAYHLSPWRVRFHQDLSGSAEFRTMSLEDATYRLVPGEGVVVSVRETIVVRRGIAGQFYPSSRCVEDGLILTSGRLEAGYRQAIILGVFNSSTRTVTLSPDYSLARVSFCWMGSEWAPTEDTVSKEIEGGVERTPEEFLDK